MKIIFIFSALFFVISLYAEVFISPLQGMQEMYGTDAQIDTKNILLTQEKFLAIQTSAQVKLDTKIYRVFTAPKNNHILGYGILLNMKVRSKNAVILYYISNDILKEIEIVAFNEPKEYLPTEIWNKQFSDVKTDKMLYLSHEIPTISGATMSARSVTDGSRIAFALYNELLKEK